MENLWTAGRSVWMKLGKEVVADLVVADTEVVAEEEVVDSSEEAEGEVDHEVEEVMVVVTGVMEEETGVMVVVIVVMVGIGAMVEEVVATRVEEATLPVAVETTTETGVLAMEIVGAPTEMAMIAMVLHTSKTQDPSLHWLLKVKVWHMEMGLYRIRSHQTAGSKKRIYYVFSLCEEEQMDSHVTVQHSLNKIHPTFETTFVLLCLLIWIINILQMKPGFRKEFFKKNKK
ncbi:hypothetical protein MHYP_G00236930 [Metynnis hypsauchen]